MTLTRIKWKFTLIELILVIGIIGVLMGITIPSFAKIMKSGGVGSSARNIVAKINASRSYAAMKHSYVALVFPGPGDTTSSSLPQQLRNTSFRPALVYFDGTDYNFINWIEGEVWDKLPAGTVFNNTNDATDTSAMSGAQTVKGCDFSDIKNSTAVANVVNCIIFNADGGLVTASPFKIGVYEATSKGDGTSTVTNADNYMKLSVNPFTGKVTYAHAL